MALKPGIFLDKDGTLLQDVPYNVDPAHMQFERGVGEGLAQLAALGRPLIVITNQPGVAMGLFDEADLRIVERSLAAMFNEAGAALAGMYHCPHGPGQEGDSPGCDCRKPAPGLLKRAAAEHGLDLARSWMVGDILNDVEAATRAGCRSVLVDNGHETQWKPGPGRTPTLRVKDFGAAARAIAAMAEGERHEHP